jgi:hypothetical protein
VKVIIKMKINTIIKKFKLEFINILKALYEQFPHLINRRGAKRKFNDNIYINWICKVLFSGISWRGLELFLNKKVDPSFNSVRNKFNEWNRIGAFKLTYITLLEKYHQKYKNNFRNLFLDATDIANINYFKEGVGYNGHKIRNKRALKLTVIATKDRVPVSFSVAPANKADVTMLEKTIENSNLDLKSDYHDPLYLTCDKGYVSGPIASRLKKKEHYFEHTKKKEDEKEIFIRN